MAVAAGHRRLLWVGGGWWRRRRWVSHEPVWESIAWMGTRSLQRCVGHPLCSETRVVR